MTEPQAEPIDSQALHEVLMAAALYRQAKPQACGHSDDPMCCPFKNFPTLAAWFKEADND